MNPATALTTAAEKRAQLPLPNVVPNPSVPLISTAPLSSQTKATAPNADVNDASIP